MSITRSHFQPAPATDRAAGLPPAEALILVAHGERGGQGDNRAIFEHAARLRLSAPLWKVLVGVLNGRPSLEDALADVQGFGSVHVLPMLMSEGYFTETVIPSRLSAAIKGSDPDRLIVHPAMGVSCALSDLAARLASDGAAGMGCAPEDVAVLLAGHGARTNGRARQAIERHARALRAADRFGSVDTAYLEEVPFLVDAVGDLTSPTVAVGMFVSDGLHAGEDVPALLNQAPCGAVHYTGAIGAHPALSDMISRQLISM